MILGLSRLRCLSLVRIISPAVSATGLGVCGRSSGGSAAPRASAGVLAVVNGKLGCSIWLSTTSELGVWCDIVDCSSGNSQSLAI